MRNDGIGAPRETPVNCPEAGPVGRYKIVFTVKFFCIGMTAETPSFGGDARQRRRGR